MENIDVKSFCLVVLGKQNGVKEELEFISESPITFIEGNHIMVATFKSTLFAKDIEMLLNNIGINFIINEIVPSLFSANLGEFHDKLFIDHNPIDSNFCYVEYKEEGKEEESKLNLDDLLDLVSKKGYKNLTKSEKEKLNQFSGKK